MSAFKNVIATLTLAVITAATAQAQAAAKLVPTGPITVPVIKAPVRTKEANSRLGNAPRAVPKSSATKEGVTASGDGFLWLTETAGNSWGTSTFGASYYLDYELSSLPFCFGCTRTDIRHTRAFGMLGASAKVFDKSYSVARVGLEIADFEEDGQRFDGFLFKGTQLVEQWDEPVEDLETSWTAFTATWSKDLFGFGVTVTATGAATAGIDTHFSSAASDRLEYQIKPFARVKVTATANATSPLGDPPAGVRGALTLVEAALDMHGHIDNSDPTDVDWTVIADYVLRQLDGELVVWVDAFGYMKEHELAKYTFAEQRGNLVSLP